MKRVFKRSKKSSLLEKRSKKKDRLLIAIRIIISISLFTFLLLYNLSSIKEMPRLLAGFDIRFAILAFLAFSLGIFVQVFRWNTLLEAKSIKIKKTFLFMSYYIGFFYSNILPSSIGGDFYRTYDICTNKKVPLQKGVAVIIMERFVGMTIGTVFLLVSFSRLYMYLGIVTIISLSILPILGVLIVFLFLKPRFFKIDRLFEKFKRLKKIEEKYYEIHNDLYLFKHNLRSIFISGGYGLLSQLIFVTSYYLVGRYLNMDLDFIVYLFLNPLIILSTILPISIGGLGIRENLAVLLLQEFGIDQNTAVIFSLINLAIILVNAFIGGIANIFKNIFYRSKGFM